MPKIQDARILIICTDGVEQLDLTTPRDELSDGAGALASWSSAAESASSFAPGATMSVTSIYYRSLILKSLDDHH